MPTFDDMKLAKQLWQDTKRQAVEVAKLRGPAPGTKRLTPDEEAVMWMKEADGWTPQKEAELWAKPGATAEAIGLEKYPHRKKILASDGRALDKLEQARYGLKVARRVDPTWTPPPPENVAPEPPAPIAGAAVVPEAPPDTAGLFAAVEAADGE